MSPSARHEKPVEVKPAESVKNSRVIVKRRVERTEKDLVEQIKQAPMIALDLTDERVESRAVIAASREAHNTISLDNDATLALIERRPDLAGLPLRRGKACRLPAPAADHFDECAQILRGQASDLMRLRKMLADDSKENKWLRNESVPVLMQILMAEDSDIRIILAQHLGHIPGNAATAALAQLALFDLNPQVRARAVAGLAGRPAGDYQQLLLVGFEHPWPAVADHAAEALVALKRTDAVPDLTSLLAAPDPRAPYSKPNSSGRFVKELVRVNHLRNCLLCHPPSFQSQDRVRGLVPPSEPRKEPVVLLYYKPSPEQSKSPPRWIFVRADVTYLKQDFSRMLPVANPGKWPAVQRFDFFVRERPATERELMESDTLEKLARTRVSFPPRYYSIVFALRELTGHDFGPTTADWKAVLFHRKHGE
jgi:hypothetical protein